MRTPESLIIPALITSELGRRLAKRVKSNTLYRWRITGASASGFIIAPRDLRPANPNNALEYYGGHFSFADVQMSTGGDSPFTLKTPNDEWFESLHRFGWLRHLQAADTELARANAAALVTDWINIWGNKLSSSAWRTDIAAPRLIAWLCHSPMLIKNAAEADYRQLLKSCSRHVRFLQNNAPHIQDGLPRLQASIALTYAALSLNGREKGLKSASRELDRELERQILPDGGHVSRNPSILLVILSDLLPLVQALKKQGSSPSSIMLSSIDRIVGAIYFFRHTTGELGQFNGTGATDIELLTTLLRYNNKPGSVLSQAPHSGYERLHAGDTVVLIDTGRPFSRSTARHAMAGTLSFELSSGSTRFIANCGVPDNEQKKYAPYTRATAAHSTVSINDRSSSRFAPDSPLHNLLPSPIVTGPKTVSSTRNNNSEFMSVTASHDGYQSSLGVVHERELHLSIDGSVLNGCDTFKHDGNEPLQSLKTAIRFHLPANISATPLSSGHSILIAGPHNEAWTFTCIDAPILLEESMQFSGPGQPRKSQQIVIYSTVEERPSLRWTFELRGGKTPERKNRQKSTAKSSDPDLLDTLNISAS